MAEMIVLKDRTDKHLGEEEQEFRTKILNCFEQDYSTVLKDAEWDLFYELSTMREGLLNWYPFKKDAQILEISDGYGALTGVISRNCKHVTVLEESLTRAECITKRYECINNISIVVGDYEDISCREQYDYVVVEKTVNTRYEAERLIENFFPFLKEDGKLLFVSENRMGMKYWCGVPDPVNHKLYDGIRGKSNLMNRKELMDALEQNEQVKGWNIYYPFPDHRLPQAIYTDSYLPKASVKDRVIFYYTEDQANDLICLENEVCDSFIADGVFHIFANSFLVECCKRDFTAETIFAALSTDRGKKHGFATVITSHDTVQKRILFEEGKESLQLIHRNQQELKEHGIGCIDEEAFERMIEMPFIKEKTLIEHLRELFLKENLKEVEAIFDELYRTICCSSKHIAFEECDIKDQRLTQENAGVILEKAYVDMIPYNSFWINRQLFFYDQEFVKKNFPAKYVLFRALRYTYVYISQAERILPLSYFKDKYGLEQIWQVFEREEALFVEDNRNYDLFSKFYQWAGVSSEKIDCNINRMLGAVKKEKKPLHRRKYDLSIYKGDIKLNALKTVQLRMLRYFHDLCEKNELSYCVWYGSLLGAVRHKGYIPWDDDVDVLMPREDYDRLIQLAPQILEEPYFLQTPENDAECFYGGYSKLRNSQTTGLEKRNEGHNCNQGIWMDVFPLDCVMKDQDKKNQQKEQIDFFQRLLLKKTYPEKRILGDLTEQQEEEYARMSRFFTREVLNKNLYETMVDFEGEKSDTVAVLARYTGGRAYKEYKKEDFEYLIKVDFEDTQVYVPSGYEQCLKVDYGEDFWVYPPEELRKPHHSAEYDILKSYIDYLGKNG